MRGIDSITAFGGGLGGGTGLLEVALCAESVLTAFGDEGVKEDEAADAALAVVETGFTPTSTSMEVDPVRASALMEGR